MMNVLLRNLLILALATVVCLPLPAELATYAYDSAGRLVSINYGSGRKTTYHYDSSGNLVRSADVVLTDSDNDGMDDEWEMDFFKTLARDGTGDFDLDGMIDLAEFLGGTLPDDDTSLLRLSHEVVAAGVTTTVEWSAVPGKVYRVQYKSAFSDPGWNDLPGTVTASSSTASKTDVATANHPTRFYRVELVQ